LGKGAVWHDVRDLAGDHWWSEIEEAIRKKASIQHVVLLASAEALTREIVRREWRVAWREGRTVINVFWSDRPGFTPPTFGSMPNWIRAKSMLDLSVADRFSALIGELRKPAQGVRRPFMPPAMREGFVKREEEFNKLKSELLNFKGDPVAITAALRGAGGFGKTVLAQALAHDDDIRNAFHDGIIWVSLGEGPNLVEKVNDVLKILTGDAPEFTEVAPAAAKLRDLLENRCCLLIVDDAWSEAAIRPFLDGAPTTARLITTRRDDILPVSAVRVPVDAMKEGEAINLLSQNLGNLVGEDCLLLRSMATDRLGAWPVILRLVNGFLRKEVERGATPREAMQQANARLDREALTHFDRNDEKAREAAVESTVRASLDYLVEEVGRTRDPRVYNEQRYRELSVFPEDVDVPIAAIARLWQHVAGIDASDARDLLKDFHNLALLEVLDLNLGIARLHDVMRKYLVQQQTTGEIRRLHSVFAEVYKRFNGSEIADNEERRYFYRWLPAHLHHARRHKLLGKLLLDPQWMEEKLLQLGGPQSLIGDYKFARNPAQRRVGQTLRLVASIVARDPRQLIPQLLGRLDANDGVDLVRFLSAARDHFRGPALLPAECSLSRAGTEIGRLEGHQDGVRDLCRLPHNRLASSSSDGTIRIWDLVQGTEIECLKGHGKSVNALCLLPTGQLASGSTDRTIRIWDLTAYIEVDRLDGHESAVQALCLLPDGHLASGSGQLIADERDCSIRIWDVPRRHCVARLRGHKRGVNAVCSLNGGRLASAGDDSRIRIWNLASARQTASWSPPQGRASSMVMLRDGRIASTSLIGPIHLWDVAQRKMVARLEGHVGPVNKLIPLQNGGLASCGADRSVILWSTATHTQIARLDGHERAVWALEELPAGGLASGSSDHSIRLWDTTVASSASIHSVHEDRVHAFAILPPGRLASGGGLNDLKIWDIRERRIIKIVQAPQVSLDAITLLNDGKLATGGFSASLREEIISLWEARSLEKVEDLKISMSEIDRRFDPTADTEVIPFCKVTSIVALDEGRFVSASSEALIRVGKELDVNWASLRLWDATSGATIAQARARSINALVFANNRLISAGDDGIIRCWSSLDLKQIEILGRDPAPISTLVSLPRKRIASGHPDGRVVVWDCETKRPIFVLSCQSPITALAYLAGKIVSAGPDRTIRLWNINSKRLVAAFEIDYIPTCLIAAQRDRVVVVGDARGHVHWLEAL
jgi:WD40 repeat protein